MCMCVHSPNPIFIYYGLVWLWVSILCIWKFDLRMTVWQSDELIGFIVSALLEMCLCVFLFFIVFIKISSYLQSYSRWERVTLGFYLILWIILYSQQYKANGCSSPLLPLFLSLLETWIRLSQRQNHFSPLNKLHIISWPKCIATTNQSQANSSKAPFIRETECACECLKVHCVCVCVLLYFCSVSHFEYYKHDMLTNAWRNINRTQ